MQLWFAQLFLLVHSDKLIKCNVSVTYLLLKCWWSTLIFQACVYCYMFTMTANPMHLYCYLLNDFTIAVSHALNLVWLNQLTCYIANHTCILAFSEPHTNFISEIVSRYNSYIAIIVYIIELFQYRKKDMSVSRSVLRIYFTNYISSYKKKSVVMFPFVSQIQSENVQMLYDSLYILFNVFSIYLLYNLVNSCVIYFSLSFSILLRVTRHVARLIIQANTS